MFLKNCWYAGSWSKDLATNLVARRILDEPIVLFRTGDGAAAALEDKCCHRGAPLSRGAVVGNAIECGYHGLQFDGSGVCVGIPGQTHVARSICVRSYPVVERWNLVWIWMGEPAAADPSSIPELRWLDDPSWAITPGYLHVKANYLLLVDNLLDLTHVSHVHKKTLWSGDPREAATPQKMTVLPDGVRAERWMLGLPPPTLFAAAGGFDGAVDRWQFSTWQPPSTVYLDVGCAKAGTGAERGDRSQGISIWSTHLVTPETETSSHYLFTYARNFGLDDRELSQFLYEGSRSTFVEDTEMLEAQQQNLEAGSIEGLINIHADAAQIQARRMLDALIAREIELERAV